MNSKIFTAGLIGLIGVLTHVQAIMVTNDEVANEVVDDVADEVADEVVDAFSPPFTYGVACTVNGEPKEGLCGEDCTSECLWSWPV